MMYEYNIHLILLVILVSIWIGSILPNETLWKKIKDSLAEAMVGVFYGSFLGYALSFHNHTGILTLGSLIGGIVLMINGENIIPRFWGFAMATFFATVGYFYFSGWGDLDYLYETMLDDFR